jgi:hypothetical protein
MLSRRLTRVTGVRGSIQHMTDHAVGALVRTVGDRHEVAQLGANDWSIGGERRAGIAMSRNRYETTMNAPWSDMWKHRSS